MQRCAETPTTHKKPFELVFWEAEASQQWANDYNVEYYKKL